MRIGCFLQCRPANAATRRRTPPAVPNAGNARHRGIRSMRGAGNFGAPAPRHRPARRCRPARPIADSVGHVDAVQPAFQPRIVHVGLPAEQRQGFASARDRRPVRCPAARCSRSRRVAGSAQARRMNSARGIACMSTMSRSVTPPTLMPSGAASTRLRETAACCAPPSRPRSSRRSRRRPARRPASSSVRARSRYRYARSSTVPNQSGSVELPKPGWCGAMTR